MGSLNIRGVAPALLRDFKMKALLEGKTLRAWVLERLLAGKPLDESNVTKATATPIRGEKGERVR